MSLAELSAYARRHHLSVRLGITPNGAKVDPDKPTRVSELAIHLGPGKDADQIKAIHLGKNTDVDRAARVLLNLVKRQPAED